MFWNWRRCGVRVARARLYRRTSRENHDTCRAADKVRVAMGLSGRDVVHFDERIGFDE